MGRLTKRLSNDLVVLDRPEVPLAYPACPQNVASKLADYEDAEEQGRLMILPKRMTYNELVGEISTINGALADVESTVYNLKKLTKLIFDTLEQREDEEDQTLKPERNN